MELSLTHQCDLLDASFTLVQEVDLTRLPLVYHQLALVKFEIGISVRPSISTDPFESI